MSAKPIEVVLEEAKMRDMAEAVPEPVYPCVKYARCGNKMPADQLFWARRDKFWICQFCKTTEMDADNTTLLSEFLKGPRRIFSPRDLGDTVQEIETHIGRETGHLMNQVVDLLVKVRGFVPTRWDQDANWRAIKSELAYVNEWVERIDHQLDRIEGISRRLMRGEK